VRVGLVGCVKTKLDRPASAAELYTSPLFVGRREVVGRTCDRWFILSALHGLVAPEESVAPYDQTLSGASRRERRRWSAQVVAALREELGQLHGITFEIHAGSAYTDHGLIDGLEAFGAEVELPVRGLGLGEQLAWYRQPSRVTDRVPGAAVPRKGRPARPRRGRYDPLREHLESSGEERVTLRFEDIEQILAASLPASARRHRPWWGNNERSSQAAAWMGAGYEVDAVDQRVGWVRFRRTR
jgi:hypothetical protein